MGPPVNPVRFILQMRQEVGMLLDVSKPSNRADAPAGLRRVMPGKKLLNIQP